MKLLRESKKGFTLLELILALGIVGFIVVISLGAIRLGTSAQETGHLKVDTFQRLRLIENQLAQKIKSTYPVFVLPEESVFTSKEFKKIPKRLLAFEGTSDSIRFVTFSAPLTSQGKPPWMHETFFFTGKHPESGKSGIIMAERTITSEHETTPVFNDSDHGQYFLLAENVAYLKFRYYQIEKLSPTTLESQTDTSVAYQGKWVTSVKQGSFRTFGELKKDEQKRKDFENNNKMSLPRAVEISLGLIEPSKAGSKKERRVIFSPPVVVPLYSGMSFALPIKQDEST